MKLAGVIDRGETDHQTAHFRDPDFLVLDRAAVVFKVEGGGGLPMEGGAAGGEEDFGARRSSPTLAIRTMIAVFQRSACASPLRDTPSLDQQSGEMLYSGRAIRECAIPLVEGLAHTAVRDK